ncbi:MAG: peptidyl-prolyl cis-trans isomerase [Gammaproteobacteria bacterium]|nr:peptidyl-prolyl cis-trans isomerase [Gammaproteobacteria bacterium]
MKVVMNTSAGELTIELNPEEAPKTVENFLAYVNDGFYDGTVFHRVIAGFMVQGGGFAAGMEKKETRASIQNEAQNGLKNAKGTLAMARTPDPHSASSQFFINVADNDFLNFQSETQNGWGYCVFGRVAEGMDVVDTMAACATTTRAGHQDVPEEDIVIISASVA